MWVVWPALPDTTTGPLLTRYTYAYPTRDVTIAIAALLLHHACPHPPGRFVPDSSAARACTVGTFPDGTGPGFYRLCRHQFFLRLPTVPPDHGYLTAPVLHWIPPLTHRTLHYHGGHCARYSPSPRTCHTTPTFARAPHYPTGCPHLPHTAHTPGTALSPYPPGLPYSEPGPVALPVPGNMPPPGHFM